ncbi:MAG: peptidylprolyl isomerase [Acholeplasmatales bacterium]|nr:peptidylprolyl isomerase [Acholeplasmatales bacterium]
MNFEKYLNDKNPRVEIEVENMGNIVVELFPEVAPLTVENFLKLVDKDFYKGIIFHRVIKGFMIQGGDPKGTGIGGSKETIKGEFLSNGVKNLLNHTRGVISMARTSYPNSASSQFFIMHDDAPYLDGEYAGFGAVVSGIDVVDMIAESSTDRNDKPLKDVKMKTIKRVR